MLRRILILIGNGFDRVRSCFRRHVDFVNEHRGEDHPNRRFLVIRRGGNCGITSYVFTVLGGVKYALEHGFVPVVDMQSEENIYLRKDEVGSRNAWDFYFEQPGGYSLSDIAGAADVTVQRDFNWPEQPTDDTVGLLKSTEELGRWRRLFEEHIHLKPELAKRIAEKREELFGDDSSDVLGVFVRGTDYVRLRPTGHTVQPEPEKVIEDVRRKMATGKFRRIFLVTEDGNIYRRFAEAFGDRNILMTSKRFLDYRSGYIGDMAVDDDRHDALRLRGEEYLASIYLLSSLSVALESIAGASVMAALLGGRGEYYFLGVYGRFGQIISNR